MTSSSRPVSPGRSAPGDMDLASACWPDLVGGTDVVLIPLGSCEQHGPHLPFVTDATVAEEVARRTARALGYDGVRAVAAPGLPYGASGEHQAFPGTLSIGHEALERVIVELGRSASTWAARMVFVNGHGGNLPTVATAVLTLRSEGRDAAWTPCQPAAADAHAGRTETSLIGALTPAAVRWERAAAGATEPVRDLIPRLRSEGVVGVSPNGVLGDPDGASAAEGETLLAGMVDRVVCCVLSGRVDRVGQLRESGEAA